MGHEGRTRQADIRHGTDVEPYGVAVVSIWPGPTGRERARSFLSKLPNGTRYSKRRKPHSVRVSRSRISIPIEPRVEEPTRGETTRRVGRRTQWFPCKTDHGSTVLFPAQISSFDVFSKSDSGWQPLPMPCALLAMSAFFWIVAPLHRRNMSQCKELCALCSGYNYRQAHFPRASRYAG